MLSNLLDSSKKTILLSFWTGLKIESLEGNRFLSDLPLNEYLDVALVSDLCVGALKKFGVDYAPTYLFVHQNEVLERSVGFDREAILSLIEKYTSRAKLLAQPAEERVADQDALDYIENTLVENPVVIFSDGLTTQVSSVLKSLEDMTILYEFVDLNEIPPSFRNEIELLGPCPLMFVRGKRFERLTEEVLESLKSENSLELRLNKLISKSRVMAFIKGTKEVPKCGFTRQLVDLFNAEGIEYETFNILEDEQVRQGLKEYSDWPTYPQVYVNGELVGGLDIIKSMGAEERAETFKLK